MYTIEATVAPDGKRHDQPRTYQTAASVRRAARALAARGFRFVVFRWRQGNADRRWCRGWARRCARRGVEWRPEWHGPRWSVMAPAWWRR